MAEKLREGECVQAGVECEGGLCFSGGKVTEFFRQEGDEFEEAEGFVKGFHEAGIRRFSFFQTMV